MSILVTGASGKLGSRVIELLMQTYKGKLIAGTRHPEKLEHLKARGVEVRKVDFDDPTSTNEAFKNVDKLFLISTDSLAVPGLRLKQHLSAIASAQKTKVKHIVYTSLTNASNSPISFAPDHDGTERALKESGLSWTILRNNWYFENLLPSVDEARKTGKLVSSTGAGRVSLVTREDCAQVAAIVLFSRDFYNQTLDVANTESYSYSDIAKAMGPNVTHENVSAEALKTGLTKSGLPGFVVDLVTSYEAAVAAGKMDVRNHVVNSIVGRKPTTLEEFFKDK